MKKTISLLLAASLFALAAESPVMAGSAARHRWEGAALTLGGLHILGGHSPLLPAFIREPISLMTLGLGSSLHERFFHGGRRHGYHGYPYDRYTRHGYEYDRLSNRESYQAPGHSYPYTTRVWVPGKNTPQGYVEGYWEVRGLGEPARYAGKPQDVKPE